MAKCTFRRFHIAAFLAIIGALTLDAPAQERSGDRTLEIDDYFKLEDVEDPRVSPDGKWIAYTVTTPDLEKNKSETRLWMVAATSPGEEAIPMTAKGGSATRPRWSPDGKYLSFLADRNDEKTQVWLLDRRGGEANRLTEVKQGVEAYEWSPDGRRLVLVVRDPKPDEEEKDDEKGKKEDDESDPPDPWVVDRLQIKLDYEGYLDRRRKHLYMFDLGTKKTTQITSGDYDDGEPAWSPDGRVIAFVSNRTEEPDANYNTDIWLVDPDNPDQGKTLTQVTSNPGADSHPVWHPSSDRIAYVTMTRPEIVDYDQPKLAVIRLGEETPIMLSEKVDRNISSPRFSPDGDTVYFLLEDRGESHLATIPVTGGDLRRPISGNRRVEAADLGPDGTIVGLISEIRMPGNLFVLDGSDLRQLSHHNDELMAGIKLADADKVKFKSPDGTEVEAFIYKPPAFNPDFRYPTILWIHGGPQAQYDFGFDFEAQLFAANGYLVVMPNPRGSTGYGVDFCLGIWKGWGIADRDDVLAAVDHAVELGYADPERLVVGGWSYGGILTNYVITSTDRFKAAISGASGALWVANYGHDQYQHWYETEFGLPWENREIWERLSPFNRVHNITTPTMWVGGEKDWNVPVQNSEQMYQAMKRLGRETLLVVYPNQHHGIDSPRYTKDLYERFLDWYKKYVK